MSTLTPRPIIYIYFVVRLPDYIGLYRRLGRPIVDNNLTRISVPKNRCIDVCFNMLPEHKRRQADSGVAKGGGHGGHALQTFGKWFFSPINLCCYVLLMCK